MPLRAWRTSSTQQRGSTVQAAPMGVKGSRDVGGVGGEGQEVVPQTHKQRGSWRHDALVLLKQIAACGKLNRGAPPVRPTEEESESNNDLSGDELAEFSSNSLLDQWDLQEDSVLGRGAFGVVSLANHKFTGSELAVKTVELRNPLVRDLTKNEVEIARDLDHPNIFRYFNAFQEQDRIHIVMEVCRGGPLFSRVVDAGTFCERDAAIVMRQALSAVLYLHCRNIVHRDLKAENFLFLSESPIEFNTLKLVDFGLATHLEPDAFLDARVGSAEYMAPQVWRGKYNHKCDVWSLGVINYTLLSGRFPFQGYNRKQLRENILAGRWDFRSPCWEQVSEEAKDLIRGLLKAGPKSRLTAEEALDHEWVSTSQTRSLDPSLVASLKVTQSQARLKKMILRMIVAWVDVDDVFVNMRSKFDALDRNSDGVLTRAELSDGLTHLGLSESETESTLEEMTNGRSEMEYTEFLSAAIHQGNFLTKDIVTRAFQLLDDDGDGLISLEDLERCHSQRAAKPRWLDHTKSLHQASVADLLHDAGVEDLQLNFAQFERWLGTFEV